MLKLYYYPERGSMSENISANATSEHSELILKYENLRFFLIGLKNGIPEKHANAIDQALRETKLNKRANNETFKLKISSLEYFLYGFRESLTGDYKSVINKILGNSDNPILAWSSLDAK